jgi:hypothetical protein
LSGIVNALFIMWQAAGCMIRLGLAGSPLKAREFMPHDPKLALNAAIASKPTPSTDKTGRSHFRDYRLTGHGVNTANRRE